jgi:hypothetical protein
MKEKPLYIMIRKYDGKRVHIYKSGETFVKDAQSTLGRYLFKSADAAFLHYDALGFRR